MSIPDPILQQVIYILNKEAIPYSYLDGTLNLKIHPLFRIVIFICSVNNCIASFILATPAYQYSCDYNNMIVQQLNYPYATNNLNVVRLNLDIISIQIPHMIETYMKKIYGETSINQPNV